MLVEFDKLTEAVTLTYKWRLRVEKVVDYRPPTAYHRILLCLWANVNDTVDAKFVSQVCGFRQQSLLSIVRRMEDDGLVTLTKAGTSHFDKSIALTELGRKIIEL
jgi:DNA-binding MarR family transcriptional regulator